VTLARRPWLYFGPAALVAGAIAVALVLTSSRDSADYGSCNQICGASGFVPKADLSGAAIAALLIA
jgi:hypothetical protein